MPIVTYADWMSEGSWFGGLNPDAWAAGYPAGYALAGLPPDPDLTPGAEGLEALAEFSEQALRLAREEAPEALAADYSLKSMDERIARVQAEIAEVWHSAMPDEEKYRLISAKKTEIALLRAGQFTMLRGGLGAGLSRAA